MSVDMNMMRAKLKGTDFESYEKYLKAETLEDSEFARQMYSLQVKAEYYLKLEIESIHKKEQFEKRRKDAIKSGRRSVWKPK